MRLVLKNDKGVVISSMEEDNRTLAFYGAENGHIILVMDLNPNSIHKEIEDLASIQKYMISEEDYEKLPENFRKWKKQLLEKNPGLFEQIANVNKPNVAGDSEDYMKNLAECVKEGSRCKLVANGSRGTVMYVGKVPGMGYGYYVGIKLDGPFGDSNAIYKGIKYFEAEEKQAVFVRPDAI